jgi:hypothetical protein
MPDDPQRHVVLGLSLAYLGRKEEAIREGQRGLALLPMAKDAYSGAYAQHQLVRIYLLVGEPEEALDQPEPLLKIPYFLSQGWLKIDPNFDPLRKTPRFQELVAAKRFRTRRTTQKGRQAWRTAGVHGEFIWRSDPMFPEAYRFVLHCNL